MATLVDTLTIPANAAVVRPRGADDAKKNFELLLVELIEQVARHDQRAMHRLFDLAGGVVYGFVQRILHNAAEAEEITLDAFLQVWRSAPGYDASRGCPMAWLLMIARSRAIDRLRATRSRATLGSPEQTTEEISSPARNPEQLCIASERSRRVRAAMVQLSPRQREAVELAYFQGMTHSEIAAQTGQPLGTAKTHLRQGILLLRKLVSHPSV